MSLCTADSGNRWLPEIPSDSNSSETLSVGWKCPQAAALPQGCLVGPQFTMHPAAGGLGCMLQVGLITNMKDGFLGDIFNTDFKEHIAQLEMRTHQTIAYMAGPGQ